MAERLRAAERLATLQRFNELERYAPLPRQREFHTKGLTDAERLFMANNQSGKSYSGSFELAMHLTGRYPDGSEVYPPDHIFVRNGAVQAGDAIWPGGWPGCVFEKPIRAWALEKTSEGVRDNPQRLLLGAAENPELWGTGAIPKDAIVDTIPGRSVAFALDSVVVRHGGGGDVQAGRSIVSFKSYDRGWQRLRGRTIDIAWCDEEPPEEEYEEIKTRTQLGQLSTKTMITFTPQSGLTKVVLQFLTEADIKAMKL